MYSRCTEAVDGFLKSKLRRGPYGQSDTLPAARIFERHRRSALMYYLCHPSCMNIPCHHGSDEILFEPFNVDGVLDSHSTTYLYASRTLDLIYRTAIYMYRMLLDS
jgi:hypothetical protein